MKNFVWTLMTSWWIWHCVSNVFGSPRASRPNIVLFLTDDQDVELGSMQFMNRTLRIMRDKGIEFINGFVTTPICCPSRSSILTGQYVHNHNVLTNNDNCTGRVWRSEHEFHTFGAYLQKSGYYTAYVGKYLNEYRGEYIPPGWDNWIGLVKNSRFYNYTVNNNGRLLAHGKDYQKDYYTDLIANDSLTIIQTHFMERREQPLLLVISFPAPHGPEDPAPQHSTLFPEIRTHRTPAWNYAPNPDKTWLLQRTGKLEPIHVVFTDLLHRRRLQTLQAVDNAIQRVVNELRDMQALHNTYLLYSSDHGYHLGQFGLVKGKNTPYEFDVKVPFFVRGPGLHRGVRIASPVANIDLAPTILDMAGLVVPARMDGRSLMPLMSRRHTDNTTLPWRHSLLIERGKMPKLQKLRDRLQRQKERFGKDTRIEMACQRPEYNTPCIRGQLWQCVRNVNGKWRILKCRDQLQVLADCQCDDEQTRRKRHTIYDESSASVAQIGRLASRSATAVRVNKRLLDAWTDQFYLQIMEDEILDTNEWHQGMFHTAANNQIVNIKHVMKTNDGHEPQKPGHKITKRDASSGRLHRSHRRRSRTDRRRSRHSAVVDEEQMTTLTQQTQCISQPGMNCTSEPDRQSVTQSIRQLKEQLRHAKNVRSQLSGSNSTPNAVKCAKCVLNTSQPNQHPLHAWSSRQYTDQELLIFKDVTRSKGRNRRRGFGRKAARRRKSSDKKKYCNEVGMNCFTHDHAHWRTPPLWSEQLGGFCFCQNSNNNTYWCVRTVNDTHNIQYCEYVTGLLSYYDIAKDPYQLHNAIYELDYSSLQEYSSQLQYLKSCTGHEQCEKYGAAWTASNTHHDHDKHS